MKFNKFLFLLLFTFGLSIGFSSCKKEVDKVDNREMIIKLDHQSEELIIGEKLILTASFGSNQNPSRTYKWFNDNSEVISLVDNGNHSATITAKKAGTAKVTISSVDGELQAVCKIIVKEPESEDPIITEPEDDGIVRILAIGNSFSQDAVENYLYDLAKAEDIKVVIGNMYIGGASLDKHWSNASSNANAYQYIKIDEYGNKTNTPNTSIATALEAENWDYVSFQQASPFSGQYSSYTTPLPSLYNYVKERVKKSTVKYILHQTWAYEQSSTHSGFANYGNNQMTMYSAIVDAVWRAKDLVPINLVIPVGTAIQNGRTSIVGDNFCRDGYHLDVNIGRYTAACTWFEAIFGKNVIGNSYKPNSLSDFEAEIAQNAAHFAVVKPKEVTELVEYQSAGTTRLLTDPVFISFGFNAPIAGWNGLLGASNYDVGAAIFNMKDTNGKETGISLQVTERFSARNTNGEKVTSTEFNMPEGVSTYSYYGNAGEPWRELEIKQSAFKLTGLNKDQKYNLCFFGSRGSNIKDNRETKYIAKGKNEGEVTLNTSNNKSDIACNYEIQPDENGEIMITVTSGENNNNTNGFFYINAMRISPAQQ